MGDIEYGQCSICGLTKNLQRKYYYYDIKCNCCGTKEGHHFEIVSYCKSCKPVPPKKISVSMDCIIDTTIWDKTE